MPSTVQPTRKIQGHDVPAFFYGTAWKEERTAELTRRALAAGFRALDTANQRKHYVEIAVGEAIAASGLARADLFLQTKFTHARGQDHRLPYDRNARVEKQVEQSIASSLEHLQTDYLDAYLLHGPTLRDALASEDWEAWRAIADARQHGLVRLIGVSNVGVVHLQALLHGGGPMPDFVQNRCYASTGWDGEVRGFCRTHGIAYQAFSLLTANGREIAAPAISQIARRHGRTREQIVFRFALQAGMFPLTGTSSLEHLRQDLECFGFELTEQEMTVIGAIRAA